MKCRHCQQQIRWGIDLSKRWIPLDPDPHPDGRWAKRGRHYTYLFGVRLEMVRWRNTPLLKRHTCTTERNHHDQ